uniref:Uncharacterized protein n=1 Tax=Anguilla anguilla TaxID=7936 RepID=A0A0E9U1C7_ANGAN
MKSYELKIATEN